MNLTSALPDVDENPVGRQGITIVRMFATLRANSTDATLSAEGAFGFIMVDGDAGAALTFPDPRFDVEAPWLYWDRRTFLPASDSGQQLVIDSKAQRRFRGNDDSLRLIFDNDDPAQTIEFVLGWRLLLKLP